MNDQTTAPRDPLLNCLEILCQWEGQPFSAQALTAGLPLIDNCLTPTLFIRALSRVGFHGKIIKRSLNELSELDGPMLLILKDNDACMVQQFHSDATVDVTISEQKDNVEHIELRQLKSIYAGYAILIQSDPFFDERVEEFNPVKKESWFWSAIFSNKNLYRHVLVAAFLTNLFVLVIPIFIMTVYDRVLPNNATSTLWALTVGAIIFFVFDFIARSLRNYYVDAAGQRADKILAHRLFQHVLAMRLAERPLSTGTFINNFNGYEYLREFFTSATLVGLIDLPFIILFLFFIWLIGGPIVLIPLVAVPLVLMISYFMELPTRRSISQALAGSAQKQAVLVETITGLEAIKAAVAEGQMQRKWERSVDATHDAQSRSRHYTSLALNATIFIQQLATVGVIIYGVYLVNDARLTVGGLIAVTILAGRSLVLGQIANLLTHLGRSQIALQSLNMIMQLGTDKKPGRHYLHRPTLNGDIEFSKVTFSYPRQQFAALENINLSIKAGERIGIIGRIGAGKSTLLKLINNFYSPEKGAVLIDGSDASEIEPADLRHNAHYVSHESTLFFGSVYDNIAMANPTASDEEIVNAAKIAGVDRFVQRHPEGYNMPVGERGEVLSAGQRQAVALARAILAKPNIFLLDEPSASVDNNFEQEFIEAFRPHLEGKTLVQVTHRASMLALVDRVIVIEAGNIVADGPRDQILERLAQQNPSSQN
jgi:ATP-binding cassette, subfamily C, bacterial LapB